MQAMGTRFCDNRFYRGSLIRFSNFQCCLKEPLFPNVLNFGSPNPKMSPSPPKHPKPPKPPDTSQKPPETTEDQKPSFPPPVPSSLSSLRFVGCACEERKAHGEAHGRGLQGVPRAAGELRPGSRFQSPWGFGVVGGGGWGGCGGGGGPLRLGFGVSG